MVKSRTPAAAGRVLVLTLRRWILNPEKVKLTNTMVATRGGIFNALIHRAGHSVPRLSGPFWETLEGPSAPGSLWQQPAWYQEQVAYQRIRLWTAEQREVKSRRRGHVRGTDSLLMPTESGNYIMPFAATRMRLEGITVRESVRQGRTNVTWYHLYMG